MSINLVEYTEEELIIKYIIRNCNARIKEARTTMDKMQESCEHRHVNIEHKRVDSYPPEFYSNMRCLVCCKRWTEEGSK
jgi:hypothetical protein